MKVRSVWVFLFYQPGLFKQFKNLFFGNVFELAFVVDKHQVNLAVLVHKVSDNSYDTRFPFSFRGNGHAYFVNVVAKMDTGTRAPRPPRLSEAETRGRLFRICNAFKTS